MNIDSLTFRAVATAILPPGATLTPGEATAMVRLAYLTSDADLDEDGDELALREQLGRQVCSLAGISFESVPRPSPVPLPNDDEARTAWLAKICGELTTPARELAYVISYLLAISDLELAPVETAFLSELQNRLGISDERASELVAHAAEQVTPMSSTGAGGSGAGSSAPHTGSKFRARPEEPAALDAELGARRP